MTAAKAYLAALIAAANSRQAHHEAGHAVAVVHRGGHLVEVYLGTVEDWTDRRNRPPNPGSAETGGATVHRTRLEHQPFCTFAGPWAEARWSVENEPEVHDLVEALGYAWENSYDGDGAKYEGRIETLTNIAADLGFSVIARVWESEWIEELDELWPAVCEVAESLLAGETVTHDTIHAALDRIEPST